MILSVTLVYYYYSARTFELGLAIHSVVEAKLIVICSRG